MASSMVCVPIDAQLSIIIILLYCSYSNESMQYVVSSLSLKNGFTVDCPSRLKDLMYPYKSLIL